MRRSLDHHLGFLSPLPGTILVLAGRFVAWVQILCRVQAPPRRLEVRESTELARVFQGSLDFGVIRIVEGPCGLFDLSARPFTLCNTIYLKRAGCSIPLLVHEAVHVWQYQHSGNRYASDALFAQWCIADAYDWRREIQTGKTDWRDFNNEAQARFIEQLWTQGALLDEGGREMRRGEGAFFETGNIMTSGRFEMDGRDYTPLARSALQTLRCG